MNKILWKVLPIIIGLTFGFLFFNPPELFRSLGWIGWLIFPGCFVFIVFIFMPGFYFIRHIFGNAELIPIVRDLRRKDVSLLAEKFSTLGFKPAGAALKVPNLSATIVGFVREDINVSAAIVRVEAGRGKTTFAFQSSLDNGTKSLTTSREISSVLMPCPPWNFRQVFPGDDAESLLLEHIRSLEFLHSNGLRTYPVSSETFIETELKGWQKHREYLRIKWFKNTLIFVWRFVSRISPYRGPIAMQKAAAKYIRQVAGVTETTTESQTRQKMIIHLQQLQNIPVAAVHSGVGITSFVISLAIGLAVFAVFVFVVIINIVNGSIGDREYPIAMILGMIIMFSGLGYVIGLILGIIGVLKKHRKRVFAVLGIIFNLLGLAVFGSVILIGLLAG